jgi:hypothetical protein
MCLPYTSVEDAQQHLLNSVILFDGRPVYVRDIYTTDDGLNTCLRFLPRMADEIHVSLFDPRIETKELGSRLGYMNIGGRTGAMYVRRIPARQYKQGLVRQNVLVGGDRRSGSAYRFDDAMRQGSFVDMMTRVYPTYEAAYQTLKDQPELPSIAFSPEFAIVRQELGFFLLEYKGEQVAWGDPKMLKLPSQFSYLKELLNKYGVSYDA